MGKRVGDNATSKHGSTPESSDLSMHLYMKKKTTVKIFECIHGYAVINSSLLSYLSLYCSQSTWNPETEKVFDM